MYSNYFIPPSQLYNFAATFPVDFTFEGTRKFLLWHMAALTLSFLACVTGVISAGLRDADWLAENVPEDSVLNNYDVQGRYGCSVMRSPLGHYVRSH